MQQFREYVSALNKQFNEWVNRQWAQNSTRFWSTGLQDYLRNVAKIRREFADVLSDDGEGGPSCAAAAPAAAPDPTRPKVPFPFITPDSLPVCRQQGWPWQWSLHAALGWRQHADLDRRRHGRA